MQKNLAFLVRRGIQSLCLKRDNGHTFVLKDKTHKP